MKMVWIEQDGCSGNIISLLDGTQPGFDYMISEMVDLVYEHSLMTAQGEEALSHLFDLPEQSFILCAEGAVPMKNEGKYLIVGRYNNADVTAMDLIKMLGEKAAYVIAVGACATHGGVSAGRPNPSECVGIQDFISRQVIKLPGCPCHPEWFLSTLSHLIYYGMPALDQEGRPLFLYGITIHQRCERRSYFDLGIFATKLSDQTCMFRLGCKGPRTPIDCPVREWNERVSWPVQANTPCIGCAQFGFPDLMEPFVYYYSAAGASAGGPVNE